MKTADGPVDLNWMVLVPGVAFGMVGLPNGAKLAWIVYCWAPITSGVCPPSSTVAVPLGANETVISAICESDSISSPQSSMRYAMSS